MLHWMLVSIVLSLVFILDIGAPHIHKAGPDASFSSPSSVPQFHDSFSAASSLPARCSHPNSFSLLLQVSPGRMELRGGFDAEPVFGGDDSLSHGSSEVEELQNLLSPNYAGGREQRLSALERIQRGLLEKISGTPGLGPPPPGLLFGDPENDAAGLPYGVAGPRKTWKDVRGEDEDEMEDGQVVLEKEGVSEHTHPYHVSRPRRKPSKYFHTALQKF